LNRVQLKRGADLVKKQEHMLTSRATTKDTEGVELGDFNFKPRKKKLGMTSRKILSQI